jgi:hypothetical protein
MINKFKFVLLLETSLTDQSCSKAISNNKEDHVAVHDDKRIVQIQWFLVPVFEIFVFDVIPPSLHLSL